MEVSGAVLRRSVVCAGVGPSSSSVVAGPVRMKGGSRRTMAVAVVGGGFCDEGHISYYVAPARCGKKKKEEEVKRKKSVKGLSRDLAALCAKGAPFDLASEVKGNSISEAAQMLLAQLEQLRTQDKETRRKNREAKAAKKLAKMKACNADSSDESSSSSSESSDSECEEVMNMRNLGTLAVPDAKFGELSLPSVEPACDGGGQSLTEERQQESAVMVELQDFKITSDGCCGSSSLLVGKPMDKIDGCCNRDESSGTGTTAVVTVPEATYVELPLAPVELVCNSGAQPKFGELDCRRAGTCTSSINSLAAAAMDKVEVCVGGKCKRSGALELMAEFERRIGTEGAVVGCKCMGKCKQGPNVRVSSRRNADEVSKSLNSLCIGVGMEDVGTIVANFFGEGKQGVGGLMAA